ncbi:WD40 repeat protein [Ceratobasidium sp. AG-Ba]|nr:WD40 repeat protein [Ceratobasidium sp. AG-Ba]
MFHKPKWFNHLRKRSSDRTSIPTVPDDLWQGLVRLQHLLDIRTSEDFPAQFSAPFQSNIRTERFKVASRLLQQMISSLEGIEELVEQLSSSVYPLRLLKSRIEPLLDLGSGGPSMSDVPTRSFVVSRLREIHIELARFVAFLDEPVSEAILSFPSHSSALQYGSPVLEDLGIQCCKRNTRVDEIEYLQSWVLDSTASSMQAVTGAAGAGKTTVAYTLCQWMSESSISNVSCFCSPYGLGDNSGLDVVVSLSHQLACQWPAYRWALAQELKGRTEVFTMNYLEAVRRLILSPLMRSSHTLCERVIVVIDGLRLSEGKVTQPECSLLQALLEASMSVPIRIVCTARAGSDLYHWIKDDALRDSVTELCLDVVDGSILHVSMESDPETTRGNLPDSKTSTQELGELPIPTVESMNHTPADCSYGSDRHQLVAESSKHKSGDYSLRESEDALLLALDRCASEAGETNVNRIINILACASEPLDFAILRRMTGGLDRTLVSSLAPMVYLTASQSRKQAANSIIDYQPRKQELTGHTNSVWSVAYSPDGAYIASGSSDDTIRMWDAHIGQQVGHPLTGHTDSVRSVAYSPDGAYIASGSYDKTIRMWDAHTGQQVGHPLTGHTNWVRSVAYSPDGAYIASGSSDDTIRMWDAHTGQQVGHPLTGHTNPVWSVAYSPDGAYIASGSFDKTIRMWDAHTSQQVVHPLTGHTDWVWSVAYSPDGAYIASGSEDKTIRMWDAHTGQQVGHPLTGHTDSVRSVAYSPDGAYIASGSVDKTIRMWDAHTGQQVGHPLTGHTSPVLSVAYSPDGAYIASGSYDNTIRIWDFTSLNDRPLSIYVLTTDGTTEVCDVDTNGWVLDKHGDRLVHIPPRVRRRFLFHRSDDEVLALDLREVQLGDAWYENLKNYGQPDQPADYRAAGQDLISFSAPSE